MIFQDMNFQLWEAIINRLEDLTVLYRKEAEICAITVMYNYGRLVSKFKGNMYLFNIF